MTESEMPRADAGATICQWCQQPCTPRQIATRRFCGNQCRNAFHGALRVFGAREFDAGNVCLAELRDLAAGKLLPDLTADSPQA